MMSLEDIMTIENEKSLIYLIRLCVIVATIVFFQVHTYFCKCPKQTKFGQQWSLKKISSITGVI